MSTTVLLVAPFGRDAVLLQQRLAHAAITSNVVPDLERASAAVTPETGALIVSEEALSDAGVARLLQVITAQPEWSDLPVLVLTAASAPLVSGRAGPLTLLESAANVTLLDRPVQTRTPLRAAHAALRARQRQYDMRDVLERERATRVHVEAASRAKDEFL
ncbi:MAG: hybrid sensor histidine kinase/response regulator, partial [Myxococcota bacterium]|nr:hybrid sensor histidine kinase/response regulator [Myxococcota bacterium]